MNYCPDYFVAGEMVVMTEVGERQARMGDSEQI